MKALTLTQPWAQLVADGLKTVETRSWTTYYRGLVAIHAAKGMPEFARAFAATELALGRVPARIARGAIIGLAEIENVERTEDVEQELSALERYYGDYSPGRYAWFLKLHVKLADPIPCRGALGLWDLPADIAAHMGVKGTQ